VAFVVVVAIVVAIAVVTLPPLFLLMRLPQLLEFPLAPPETCGSPVVAAKA